MDIHVNEVYYPYLHNTDRYLVLYGGAGSGKSYFAVDKMLIRIMNEEGHRILFVRKVAKTIRSSVFQLTKDEIAKFGRTSLFDINKTEMRFTYANGNEIICVGMDDPEKLKSIQGITSIWVEEATELDEDDLDQLDLRLRGHTPHYKQIILSFNPININHWLKIRFEDHKPVNATVLKTTYLHNAFIDPEYKLVLDQKAEVNPNYARIYKDGEWGLPEVDKPFTYAFSDKNISDDIKLNPQETVYLSFDFNVSPMTVTAHQYRYMDYYHTLYEFRANNSGTKEMCQMIKNSEIGNCHFIVTGDATGRNRSSIGGNLNNYTIIMNELGLSQGQIKVPRSNPSYSESRTLTNHIYALHPKRYIHSRCKYFIEDLRSVEADDKDKPKPPDGTMGHLLDGGRYMDNTFFYGFVKDSARLITK